MKSTTINRVQQHSPAHANAEIRRQTELSVLYHAWRLKESPDGVEELDRRLEDLDREWDIERTLEANAASLALVGLALAATVDRRWMRRWTGAG